MSIAIQRPRAEARSRPFNSLFLAGFECANHLTPAGARMDVIASTQHDRFAAEDYRRCREAGLLAVREAARWPIADTSRTIDVGAVTRLARLARQEGLTVVWDLFHYGYPDDLDASGEGFADRFIERFVAFAAAVARAVRPETDGPTWWTPINEISYTAWAAGDAGIFAPFWHGRGWEYKVLLVRAWIQAFDAIRAIDPAARTMAAEPLVRLHVHPDVRDPERRTALQAEADDFNTRVVSEAYDMLAGRVAPDLGGSRQHLGVVGVNYYEGNQWTIATPELPQAFLGRDDPAWLHLGDILAELEARYGGPIVISETGSTGAARPDWLRHIAAEVERATARGVDVGGICLYPVVTSPDWNDTAAFFDGGLWDVEPQPDGTLRRTIVPALARALVDAQRRLSPDLPAATFDIPDAAEIEEPGYVFAAPEREARFSPDGFVSVPLVGGDSMVADLYCLEPGKSVAGHRHPETEHILTCVAGNVDVRVGDAWVTLQTGEVLLVPSGALHGIHNPSTQRAMVQQVSSPKPWDARHAGPRPSQIARPGRSAEPPAPA